MPTRPTPPPERLRPDNVTPPVRTPWGGQWIAACHKARLGVVAAADRIGEAWEISVEPTFPSRLARTGELLSDVIARDPAAWLGPAAARHDGRLPLLVKVLDAAETLSVQVHPAADDPALAPGESGKPEAWIIVGAAPGAGIYLGFQAGVARADVEACLARGAGLDALLNFVPVAPGDTFVVAAGTVHAIGAGVTLVEPQLVLPGKRAVTYRLWDWGRRYDPNGRPDPAGQPRPLHVARALDVADWGAPRGAAFVAGCRSATPVLAAAGPRRERVLATPWCTAEGWTGDGSWTIGVDAFMGIVCLGGRLSIETASGAVALACGESAVVPAAAGQARLHGEAVDAVMCAPGVTA